MSGALAGRSVLVTGGLGALGRAVVANLLRDGATCHVPTRRKSVGPGDADWIDHPNVHLHPQRDVGSAGDVAAVIAQMSTPWAAINVAGGFRFGGIDDAAPADLVDLVEQNLLTAFTVCVLAARRMKVIGDGRIVNVASRPALDPKQGANMVAYTASKAAVAAMTVALAAELGKHGVAVNAVAPSVIDTADNRAAMPKADHSRWPKPDEIADIIRGLVSPANLSIQGAVVPVFGRA